MASDGVLRLLAKCYHHKPFEHDNVDSDVMESLAASFFLFRHMRFPDSDEIDKSCLVYSFLEDAANLTTLSHENA